MSCVLQRRSARQQQQVHQLAPLVKSQPLVQESVRTALPATHAQQLIQLPLLPVPMENTAATDNVWLALLENTVPLRLSSAAVPLGPGLQPSTSSAEPARMATAVRQPARQWPVPPTNMSTTLLAHLVLLALNVSISIPNLLARQVGSGSRQLEPVPSAPREVNARRQTRKPHHVQLAHFLRPEPLLASPAQLERLALEPARHDQQPRSQYALPAHRGCLKQVEAEPAHQQLMVSTPCRLMLQPNHAQLVSSPRAVDKLSVILRLPRSKRKLLLAPKAQSSSNVLQIPNMVLLEALLASPATVLSPAISTDRAKTLHVSQVITSIKQQILVP